MTTIKWNNNRLSNNNTRTNTLWSNVINWEYEPATCSAWSGFHIGKLCEGRKRMKSISLCKWLIQLKRIDPKVVRNLPGSKNPSGKWHRPRILDIISDKFSSVQVEVNPPAPVDPHIQHPSTLMPSYMEIFGPAQGSSCPSVSRDPRQHNCIPGVVWQVHEL